MKRWSTIPVLVGALRNMLSSTPKDKKRTIPLSNLLHTSLPSEPTSQTVAEKDAEKIRVVTNAALEGERC